MEIAGENPFIEIRVIFLTIAHSRDREVMKCPSNLRG